MTAIEYKVTLSGSAVRRRGASPAAAGAVLKVMERSLHGAVEVAFRRSSGAGRREKWLRQAGDAEFVHVEKAGPREMALFFEAPQFGDVAQEFYRQPTLFGGQPAQTDTAFDLLADAAGDVGAREADSERFDIGLLKRFEHYQTAVFDKGIDELVISGHRITKHPCRLTPTFSRKARDLYLQTPMPSRVRVAGRLDLVQASTHAFELLLPGGEKVRAVWRKDDLETLRLLLDKEVVASGMAVYRPSGRLLRIDCDALGLQRPGDGFFAVVPSATDGRLDLHSLIREQRKRGGVAAIWGKIATEESDEDFLQAVAEID